MSPPPAAEPGAVQPATLGNRFLARLIDGILIGIVFWIVYTIAAVAFFRDPVAQLERLVTTGSTTGFFGSVFGPMFIASLVAGVGAVAYYVLMESSRGQTVGKMFLKLEVRGPAGGRPTTQEAFRRNAWQLLSVVPFLGGFAQLVVVIIIAVTINNNTTTRQGWHDEFAGGTTVQQLS